MANRTQANYSRSTCTQNILAAYLTLRKSPKVIKSLFYDREINVCNEIINGDKEKIIEIELDNATLTCLFDNDNYCDGSYLFLNEVTDILYYIDYCNKVYYYDYIAKGWVYRNSYIKIETDKDDCFLLFKPVKL